VRLRLASIRKRFANGVVNLDVSHRIRTRRTANRRLIDENHFIDVFRSFDLLKRADVTLPFARFLLQSRVNAIVNQRLFARATHASHADEHVKRNVNIDRFKIVFARAANFQLL